MANVVDLEDRDIAKIKLLAVDNQLERLKNYPCPCCEKGINLVQRWQCGCCGGYTSTLKPRFFPWRRIPLGTVLDGCSDKYCDQPKQTAIQCPYCEAILVIDRSISIMKAQNPTPVVAKPIAPSPYEGMGLLGAIAEIADATVPGGAERLLRDAGSEWLGEYEHKQDMAKAQRDNEKREAGIHDASPSGEDPDAADWFRKHGL
jgi:ribosomal protein S27AE